MVVTHKNDMKQSNGLEPMLKPTFHSPISYSQLYLTINKLIPYLGIKGPSWHHFLTPLYHKVLPCSKHSVAFPNHVLFHIWFSLPKWIYPPTFRWRNAVLP